MAEEISEESEITPFIELPEKDYLLEAIQRTQIQKPLKIRKKLEPPGTFKWKN